MIWLFWCGAGILLGAVSTYFALKLFPKYNLLDFPERYGLKRDRLPYPGGLVLWLLSFGLLLISTEFWLLFLPLLVLGGISFIDDRVRVSSFKRLIVQLWLAAFLVIMGIKITYLTDPFGATNIELLPWLGFGLSVVWIVAIQNAINWFDGLPGLSVGISAIGFLILGILGLVRPELFFDPAHANLTLANFYLAGLCMGAWWWYWRGKIILGDTGSQVLGFLLAVMAIWSGAKIATTLLVLSLPMLDFFWVIFRRLVLQKKSPFKGDMAHMHHLLAQKLKGRLVTLYLLFSSLILGLAALLFDPVTKRWSFLLLALVIVSLNWWLFRCSKPAQLPQ